MKQAIPLPSFESTSLFNIPRNDSIDEGPLFRQYGHVNALSANEEAATPHPPHSICPQHG